MKYLGETWLALMLTGCATHGVAPAVAAVVPSNRYYWDEAGGDGYRIKVTRDIGKMGSLCLAKIAIDGKLAAELSNGESAIFKVPVGRHVITAALSLETSVCQTFYSSAQMQSGAQASVEGQAGGLQTFRYGFTSSGLPVLTPSSL